MNRTRDQDGAVAVTLAITMTVLILMAAFVIDLGLQRVDSGRGQSASDMAAAAGASALISFEGDANAREACETALEYARVNLDFGAAAAAIDGRSCESQFGSLTECTALTVVAPARYRVGRHIIEITLPVADNDPLMLGLSHGPEYDQTPCDRLGVSITSERDFLLAGAGGIAGSGATNRGAVGVAFIDSETEVFASLVVLDPTACQSMVVNSTNGVIRIGTTTVGGITYPGIISVYAIPSPGACTSNNNQVINPNNASGVELSADGFIFSYGLAQGAAPNQIYSQEKVDSGNLSPRPRSGPREIRSKIDHDYNCLDPYPTASSDPNWRPNRAGLVYDDCTEGGATHIFDLHAAYQAYSAHPTNPANDTLPDGWLVFPRDWNNDATVADKSCNDATFTSGEAIPAYSGPSAVAPSHYGERWFIDCDGQNGPRTLNAQGLVLEDLESVIFSGPVAQGGTDAGLTITGSSTTGTVVYIQQGGITRNQGDVRIDNAFIYLDDGRVNMAGTSGFVSFTALPKAAQANCATIGVVPNVPNAACFAPLTVWTNKAGTQQQDRNRLGGGASVVVRGIFFSPNTETNIAGSGDTETLDCSPEAAIPPGTKLNLRDAQFWARIINVTGSGAVTLCPSPEFAKETEFPVSGLIR